LTSDLDTDHYIPLWNVCEGGSSSGYCEPERAHQDIWFYRQAKPKRDASKRGCKTNGKQNDCIPNESKPLIINAYWEFLRTESSRLPVEV